MPRPHLIEPAGRAAGTGRNPQAIQPPAPASQLDTRWAAAGLSAGDLIMARRQLLNLKHLAERHYRQGTPRL
jgi:hypothetical protein